jgi:hypothetical protein
LGSVTLFIEIALVIVGITQLPLMDGALVPIPNAIGIAAFRAASILGLAGLVASIVGLVRREGATVALIGLGMCLVTLAFSVLR